MNHSNTWIAAFFFLLGLIIAGDLIYRISRKDMSASGAKITPSTTPWGYRISVTWQTIVFLGVIGFSIYILFHK